MIVRERKIGHVRIYELEGDFDLETSDSFRQTLLEVARAEKDVAFVIEMTKVDVLDSTAIGTLLVLHRRLEKPERMRLCGLSKRMAAIFENAYLHQIFQLDPDLPASLAKLGVEA